MKVTTFQGIVENGQIRLAANVRLPENATVYVVIPNVEIPQVSYVGSPRLVHPEQAADFKKEVAKELVQEQIDEGGYGTASEYIRQLIREERKRQGRVFVEEKLQEALDSGEPEIVNTATWKESEKQVEERIKATSKKRRANGDTD